MSEPDVLKISITIPKAVYPELYAEMMKVENGRRRANRIKLLASDSLISKNRLPQQEHNGFIQKKVSSALEKAFGQSMSMLND